VNPPSTQDFAEGAARPPHLLIAEDDASSAAVLRTMLSRSGYHVEIAEDGTEVLRLLERGALPDVLLLDWMLPGVSGLEVCHRIRQRWNALELPILMVTAKTDSESVSAAFDAGASDYIAKPFLGAELRARIASHLRTKRLVEERTLMEEHLREREKLSVLGLLVSSVAHDLNNPLTGISGYAQLLLRREDDEEKGADLRCILSEVERCRRIVGELLGFVRRRPATRELVKLCEVLSSTLKLRERDLRVAGIDAELQVEGPLPPLQGDFHQLQQVFLNLLLNAEHALLRGGRTLRARATSGEDGGRCWAIVEVFNDGAPIPTELLPRIWDPFFTTKGEREGTGLGLAICRRIVEEHGGAIEVESGAQGTVFRVRLPGAANPGA
jgi:signal transduction histidine kinase